MRDLRVVDVHEGFFGLEVADETDRCRLARVTRVSFERESKDGDALEDHGFSNGRYERDQTTNLASDGVE